MSDGAGRTFATVVTWRDYDNFGFARLDGAAPRTRDVFVHVKETKVRLAPGTRISCVVTMNDRGPRATAVVVESQTRSARPDRRGAEGGY